MSVLLRRAAAVASVACAVFAASACVVGPAAAAAPATVPGGTLDVCASDLVNFDDMPRLALPAGLIFVEWGTAGGDLRRMRLDPDYPPARVNGQAAVVTTGPLVLTASRSCGTVGARALVSPSHRWSASTVTPGDDVFLASDTLGPDGPRPLGAEDRRLYEILTMNVLVARPVSPVADATATP